MPLPTLNDQITPYNPTSTGNALANATCAHPPVTANNTVFRAKAGHAAWVGNTLTISNVGNVNYWFIPAVQNQVSYCVVPCGGGGDAYVISDQYGGCEYHELYHATHNLLAFLHVYRGDGATTQYAAAAGWTHRSTKRSWRIARQAGMRGTNLSVSCVNRGVNPPTVQSNFVNISGYPNLTVGVEDDGDAPYRRSPCFLTTATCEAMGLPDDCEELTLLRRFRDEAMLRTNDGRRDVERYYSVAPSVVDAIDRRTDRMEFYRRLYQTRIRSAADAVRAGRFEEARAIYTEGMRALCAELGVEPEGVSAGE